MREIMRLNWALLSEHTWVDLVVVLPFLATVS